jgi:hypothetical protein
MVDHGGSSLTVVNDVLEQVLDRHGSIDPLNVDTEGTEADIIGAVDPANPRARCSDRD